MKTYDDKIIKAESEWRKITAKFSKDINSETTYYLWAKERRKLISKYNELPTTLEEDTKLATLKDKYIGKRIFLIGNGSSLNKTPLELLKNEFTFGVNRIYLLFDRISWKPTFYTVNDWEVAPDNAHEINSLEGMTFFFPTRFRGLFNESDKTYWYNSRNRRNSNDLFNFDLMDGAVMGGTIIFLAIQIACYMGFNPIILIGVDADYKIKETVKQTGKKFPDGNSQFLQSQLDDDPNHFDKNYFGKGRRWHHPNVDNMIKGFTIARNSIEQNGKQIMNATIGGKLEVLPRVRFESLF